MRTDWYEVEGHDEQWKADTIAQLGNEEDFNQEFGNQFLAGSKLLLQLESEMQGFWREYLYCFWKPVHLTSLKQYQ